MSDLIKREDAIEAIDKMICDNKWVCECAINSLPSAEAEDRHYIKIYADDEPSVKAEKLYQICCETQNREVAEWLKELQGFQWTPVEERLPDDGEKILACYDDGYMLAMQFYVGARFSFIAWMPLPEPYEEEENGTDR